MMFGEERLMTIGEVAHITGVADTTLRYYEKERIVVPGTRSRAGYRLYTDRDVERIAFVRAAQAVGFTLDDIRTLLEVGENTPCNQVQELIERRSADVENRLRDLKRVQGALADALARCRKSRKGCAVVADLKQTSRNRRKR